MPSKDEKPKKKVKAKVNDFSNLKWEAVESAKGVKSLNTKESYKEGTYTRSALKKELQELSVKFNSAGKKARVGVSFRYANAQSWVPAYLSDVGSHEVRIYDPNDSGKGKMYIDDEIDAICFYVMRGVNEVNEPTLKRKPKKRIV